MKKKPPHLIQLRIKRIHTPSTHGIENNSNHTTTTVHQPTIVNANPVIEPINGVNTEVNDNIEVNANIEIEGASAVENEKPPSVVASEEQSGMVKRKRGRPRKDPTAPKTTTIPPPHTHALRKSVRLPKSELHSFYRCIPQR